MAEKENSVLPNDKRMSLGEHLEELRRRLIYAIVGLVAAMIVGLIFGPTIIRIMERPYDLAVARLELSNEQRGELSKLSVLSAGAGFDIYMKVSFYFGLILACPWILYQIWMFVSAGLYPTERRYVSRSIPFSVALFLGGAVFFYVAVAVPAIRFLISFDYWLGLKPVITLQNHMGFMTDMVLAFGLAFQTPLVILILARVGLVSMRTLSKYRRHAIFAILVFSAVFAPPDALSMVAMAFPMWLLFEFGVLLAYLAIRKKQRREREEERKYQQELREQREAHAGEEAQPQDQEQREEDQGAQEEQEQQQSPYESAEADGQYQEGTQAGQPPQEVQDDHPDPDREPHDQPQDQPG